MKNFLNRIKESYNLSRRVKQDKWHVEGTKLIYEEKEKRPLRYDLINFLLEYLGRETKYLEIGVRFPEENFDLICSNEKYSVDPGYENPENPVDFKITSDEFFKQLKQNKILNSDILFDVIFIDGLHLADQVDKDIENAISFLKPDGFIVIHDCNPPTEFHTCEKHSYKLSPAKGYWNGTTWKAFFKHRQCDDFYSCCIDSDWGIGVISKHVNLGYPTKVINPHFEFNIFSENRKASLNLISFEAFKQKLSNSSKS